jgi:lipoprotein-releasing system permease protein
VYTLFLALRYLRAHRIVYWSIAAVAVGLFSVIVVTSVMGGFARDIRARVRGLQSDLMLMGASPELNLPDYDALRGRLLALPHVKGAAPRIEWVGSIGVKSLARKPVTVVGVKPEWERGLSRLDVFFARMGQPFRFAHPGGGVVEPPAAAAVLGAEMPYGRGTYPLTTARDATTPQILQMPIEVVGHFRSGMAEYDSTHVFIDLADAQRWLGLAGDDRLPPVVNRIAIALDDYERHGEEARRAVLTMLHDRKPCRDAGRHREGVCGAFRVMTWEESRSILLQAVAVEKSLQGIILFLVVVVAGFNIVSIYTLMVKAKTRDIGVVRALGAREQGVGGVFLLCGLLCGAIGAVIGVGAGLYVALNLNELETALRVWSRSLQPLKWDAARGAGLGVLSLLGLALWWWRIGDPWRPLRWVWASWSAIMLAGAAMYAFRWTETYVAFADDPVVPPGRHAWLFGLGIVALATLVRRAAEPLEGYLVGGLLHLVTTCLGIVATAFAVAITAVSAAMLATVHVPAGWPGLEIFPRDIYYLEGIPTDVDPVRIALLALLALVVCLVFSLHPASRAAKCDPIGAIREE